MTSPRLPVDVALCLFFVTLLNLPHRCLSTAHVLLHTAYLLGRFLRGSSPDVPKPSFFCTAFFHMHCHNQTALRPAGRRRRRAQASSQETRRRRSAPVSAPFPLSLLREPGGPARRRTCTSFLSDHCEDTKGNAVQIFVFHPEYFYT